MTGCRRRIDRPLKKTARGELKAPVAIDPKALPFRFTHWVRHDHAPPSETLVALEHQLAERLLAFETMDAAWPKGRTAIERAEIGRQREDVRSGAVALRDRIVTARAETLADAAVQLRRRAHKPEPF